MKTQTNLFAKTTTKSVTPKKADKKIRQIHFSQNLTIYKSQTLVNKYDVFRFL